jgi:hypothetical protein
MSDSDVTYKFVWFLIFCNFIIIIKVKFFSKKTKFLFEKFSYLTKNKITTQN